VQDTVIKYLGGCYEKFMHKNVKYFFYMLFWKNKIKLNFMEKTGFKNY